MELGGNGIDTNINSKDFVIRDLPQPQWSSSDPEEAQLTDDYVDLPQESEETLVNFDPIEITELLVNPLFPLTDAKNEYIELYNPNFNEISLEGYVLKSGKDFKDSYVIGSVSIPPFGYKVFYSEVTRLNLTNSGGAVQLLNEGGKVIAVTERYGEAPEGQSWSKFNDGWKWTLHSTPGEDNILAQPLFGGVKPKPAAIGKSRVKQAAKKLTAAKRTKKAPKLKVKKPKKKVVTTLTQQKVAASRNMKPATWLIITLAIFTIGYALYEFRYDIRNLYNLIRRNLYARKKNRE